MFINFSRNRVFKSVFGLHIGAVLSNSFQSLLNWKEFCSFFYKKFYFIEENRVYSLKKSSNSFQFIKYWKEFAQKRDVIYYAFTFFSTLRSRGRMSCASLY